MAGIVSGGMFHALLFGFGIAQVLAWSPALFTAVKLCGAAYLVYLGLGALRGALRRAPVTVAVGGGTDAQPLAQRWHGAWLQGALSNALNPKVAMFYLAFLPQFLTPDDHIPSRSMLLIGIHCLLGLVWLGTLALAVARLGRWLQRGAVRRALDAAVGSVMVGFGLKLGFEGVLRR